MKKILLIIGLVVLLAGVAYVKAIFSNQDKNSRLISIESVKQDLLKDYISKKDVASLIDSVKEFYRDSLYAALSDSINTLAVKPQTTPDTIVSKISSLEVSNKELRISLKKAKTELNKITKSKKAQVEKLAESFYKYEMAELPSDLTDYEKAVSVKEIKNKMKKYFNLSSRAVRRISNKYK